MSSSFVGRLVSGLLAGLLAVLPVGFTPAVAADDGLVTDWVRHFYSGSADSAWSLSVDQYGNVYVAGWTGGALSGQTSWGGTDALLCKYDSSGRELWTRQFGTIGTDCARGVAVDGRGDAFVVGWTTGVLPGQSYYGADDVFIRKYDASGNELWTRQFGTRASDSGNCVGVDRSGNAFVAGSTHGTFPGNDASGSDDAFIRKYDESGNELWTSQFGTGSADFVYGVAVDKAGAVVAVGDTGGALTGQTSSGGFDAFVQKSNSAGDVVWTHQFGTSANDGGHGISIDGYGNVFVAGSSRGSFPGQTSSGGDDAFVRKVDASGNKMWTCQFGTVGNDSVCAVKDAGSDILMAGYVSGALPGQATFNGRDAFVRRYSGSGEELWTSQFGTLSNDTATAVAASPSGLIYLTGSTGGSLSGQTPSGGDDAFLRQWDSSGNELWTRLFGGAVSILARGLAVDQSGNALVAGYTGGSVAGQSAADGGAVIRKYDDSGNTQWTRQFGTASDDFVSGIATDPPGNVLVVGYAAGAFPGLISSGGRDVFIRKYGASGNHLWTRQFGSTANDVATGVATDSSGNSFIVGYLDRALPGQTSLGGPDAFIRKFDASGNELWTRQFGTPDGDWASGVATDSSGSVFVVGWTTGNLTNPITSGNCEAFVRKYDGSGTMLWTRQFGAGEIAFAYCVAVDPAGNVFVAGSTQGAFPDTVSSGGVDAFVQKYGGSGDVLWTRQFGSPARDFAASVVTADSGDVLIAGNTCGGLPDQESSGGTDTFVRSYDGSGNELWTTQFGTGCAEDATHGIAVDKAGHIFAAGEARGSIDGLTPPCGLDCYLAKLTRPANL